MPIQPDDNKYYDFDLFFEKNCDVDMIINRFFTKFKDDIRGDTEQITHTIKNVVEEDRNFLMKMNGNGQDYLNRIGKITYLRHYVIPKQNNGKEYYVYCINSFI